MLDRSPGLNNSVYLAAVVSLAGKLRDAALASGQARQVILPLRAAIAALAPSTQYVTPIHAMMLRWCVASPSVLLCIDDVSPNLV